MKKLFIALFVLLSTSAFTQKIAYVDTQYILDNIPDYKMAQDQLDELSKKWQKEIEAELATIDKMYKQFQADAVLLPEDIKKKKEDEIIQKEKEIKALQKKRFGQDGDLFKKREELIKPIQDKIFNAIEELSTENAYSIVFDKAGSLTIMYASSKIDISDKVLEKLGYSANPKTKKTTPNKNTNKTTDPKSE